MELDCRHVLYIPLSRWEIDTLIALDVDDMLGELVNLLEDEGFDSFYLTKVASYYKSRRFDEVTLTIFASSGDEPHEIFRRWFLDHNDVLGQEAFAYEIGNKMVIEPL